MVDGRAAKNTAILFVPFLNPVYADKDNNFQEVLSTAGGWRWGKEYKILPESSSWMKELEAVLTEVLGSGIPPTTIVDELDGDGEGDTCL